MSDAGSVPTRATVAADIASFPRVLHGGLGALGFIAVFLILDRISYLDTLRVFAVMAWNPVFGLCVAAGALWGRKVLPLIFICPFIAATLIRGFPLTPFYTLALASLTVLKVIAIVRGGEWLEKVAAGSLFWNRQSTILLIAVPVTLVASFINASGISLAGILPAHKILETSARLWIGDLIGVFVQTRFFMLLYRLIGAPPRITVSGALEVFVQSVLVACTVWFIFGLHRAEASDYFYLLFLPMIWIVLNHALTGAIILNMLVQASTISYLLLTGPEESDLIFFQALAIVFVASSLTLGFSVDQIRAATQRLRAREQEVAATLKVAATSELAGALAHEISHPLGAVSNYAVALTQIVGKTEGADPALITIANKLRQEARRASDTLRRMREFFRTGSVALASVDVGDLINDSLAFIATRVAGRSITVRTVIDPTTPRVLADRIQLLGVLHNLMLNAVEAVETMRMDNRQIVVSAGRRNDEVFMAIADSGPGISADIRDHVFEALTTTKSYGLGLGLSISRSIVQAHGGRIEFGDSNLGGTKFIVSLPVDRIGGTT
jgi:signal transduction histidine kinase